MAFYFQFAGQAVDVLFSLPATLNVTFMCWAYFPSTPSVAYHNLVQMLDVSFIARPWFYADISDGRTIAFDADDGTAASNTFQAPVAAWFHVAMTIASSATNNHILYGYVNGKLATSLRSTVTWGAFNGLRIGNLNNGGENYVRDVRCWGSTLNGSQIWSEFNSTVPVHKNGLIAYNTFDSSDQSKNLCNNANQFVPNQAITFVGLGRSNNGRKPKTSNLY